MSISMRRGPKVSIPECPLWWYGALAWTTFVVRWSVQTWAVWKDYDFLPTHLVSLLTEWYGARGYHVEWLRGWMDGTWVGDRWLYGRMNRPSNHWMGTSPITDQFGLAQVDSPKHSAANAIPKLRKISHRFTVSCPQFNVSGHLTTACAAFSPPP